VWAVPFPEEANAELVVQPDAVLPLSVVFKGVQMISGWHVQIFQPSYCVQLREFYG
jgi:hypothetical protein